MTKKHFRMLAALIKDSYESAHHNGSTGTAAILILTQTLCSELKRENPNFDKERFLAACGFPR